MEEAGSGWASPDLGQIWPSRLVGQPGVRGEPVRCLGRSIRRRSMAGVRRPHRLAAGFGRDTRFQSGCGRIQARLGRVRARGG
jgi:hypothetical protein